MRHRMPSHIIGRGGEKKRTGKERCGDNVFQVFCVYLCVQSGTMLIGCKTALYWKSENSLCAAVWMSMVPWVETVTVKEPDLDNILVGAFSFLFEGNIFQMLATVTFNAISTLPCTLNIEVLNGYWVRFNQRVIGSSSKKVLCSSCSTIKCQDRWESLDMIISSITDLSNYLYCKVQHLDCSHAILVVT